MNIFNGKLNNYFVILATIVVSFFLIEIIYYVIFLNTWFDEANYVYKGWLTAEGLAEPFVDFRTKYGPFGFYTQTFLQDFFGATLIGARILSAFFLIGIASLIFSIGRKIGNKWIGLTAFAMLVFHPYLVGYYTSAIPYAMAVFFPLLSVWILMRERMGEKKKIVLSSLAMTSSILVRYNMLPALIVLWIYIFFKYKNWKYVALSIGSSVALFALAFIPYALLDFQYSIIWFLMMFGPFIKFLPESYSQIPTDIVNTKSFSIFYLFNESNFKSFIKFFTQYFALWVGFFTGIVMAIFIGWKKFKIFSSKNSIIVFAFALVSALFTAHYLSPTPGQLLYSLYFLPFLILSVSGLIYLLYKHLEDSGAWESSKIIFSAVIGVTILLGAFTTALSGQGIIFFNHFNVEDSDLNRVKKGGLFLKENTSSEDTILALDGPHHVLLAERYEIPPLINIEFTYFADIDDEELLKRYAFYNFPMFMEWVKNDADVIVFQRDGIGESFLSENNQNLSEFFSVLKDKFELSGSIENVYPRKYTRGEGIMDIYKRK